MSKPLNVFDELNLSDALIVVPTATKFALSGFMLVKFESIFTLSEKVIAR